MSKNELCEKFLHRHGIPVISSVPMVDHKKTVLSCVAQRVHFINWTLNAPCVPVSGSSMSGFISFVTHTAMYLCVVPCVWGAHVLCHRVEVRGHHLVLVLAFHQVCIRICCCLLSNTSGLASSWASWDLPVSISHLPSRTTVSGFMSTGRIQAQDHMAEQ